MIEIIDINDERIKPYKDLKKSSPTLFGKNLCLSESEKVTLKLLKSELEIVSIFATKDYYLKYDELIKSKKICGSKMFYAEKSVMSQIVGFNLHKGIMAICRQQSESDYCDFGQKIVLLNSVVDSENVGSIVRNAVAFDFDSLIYDKRTSSPFLRRAIRVSVGSAFSIKHKRENDMLESVAKLKELNYQVYAAEICDSSVSIDKVSKPEKIAIVFGSEGNGIAENILAECDEIIHIPISKKFDSINVAASSAIIMHHFSK